MSKLYESIKNFRFKSAIILSIIFVGLLVFVLVFEKNRTVKEEETGLTTFTVWDLKKDDLKQVVFINKAGELTLTKKDDGSWMGKRKPKDDKDKPEEFKVDKSKLDTVLDELIKVEATEKIEKPNLKEYGLDNVKLKVSFEFKDGKKLDLNIGDKTPEGTQHYVKVSSQDYVFLAPTSLKAKAETEEKDLK